MYPVSIACEGRCQSVDASRQKLAAVLKKLNLQLLLFMLSFYWGAYFMWGANEVVKRCICSFLCLLSKFLPTHKS